jgi:hypothetical protein
MDPAFAKSFKEETWALYAVGLLAAALRRYVGNIFLNLSCGDSCMLKLFYFLPAALLASNGLAYAVYRSMII